MDLNHKLRTEKTENEFNAGANKKSPQKEEKTGGNWRKYAAKPFWGGRS